MQKTAQKIDFYFDFLSPFSYFAWINHQKLGLDTRYEFNYRPVLMGKLFEHWDIKGPGEIAPKRYLMLKSCFRYASRENIEFVPPETHPFNPLYVLRLATLACGGKAQMKVIDSLWSYIWGKGNTGDNPDALESFLNDVSLPGTELMEKAFAREAKLELKQNTKEAIANKLFGVPSFVCGDEVFWGNDSLTDLIQFIEGEEAYDQGLFLERTSDIKMDE